jgi:flagellar protein FlgJ
MYQTLKTHEQGASGLYNTIAKFRAYNSPDEGFKDYVSLLANNTRYKDLIGVSNPYEAAEIMSKTGYATDKNYKQKLQSIIKQIQQS